ncbi:MAG: hypothetical protein JJU45_03510 [Acidimicrobiia bacterium]|nr:hypothetical protein [Acidimicrobiia bacterium]
MSVHPPIVRRFVPPSDEELAESRAAFERRRAEAEAARAAARPARRAAILAGPPLRDVNAAVDCRCGCHPRPADVGHHDGGRACPCQESEAERSARRTSFLAAWSALAEHGADEERAHGERQERFDATAVALGVDARIEVGAAPFVIVGVCDGRGFYLRERHGSYRVTIAPDDDPGADPWATEPTEASIDVAAGDACELDDDGAFSPAGALRVAVGAVRTALARNTCDHQPVEAEPYCPRCGVPLAESEAWRWSTTPSDGPT